MRGGSQPDSESVSWVMRVHSTKNEKIWAIRRETLTLNYKVNYAMSKMHFLAFSKMSRADSNIKAKTTNSIIEGCWFKSRLFKDIFYIEQVEGESVGYAPSWIKNNFCSLSPGGFWMWRWRVDAGLEDWRQQGVTFIGLHSKRPQSCKI